MTTYRRADKGMLGGWCAVVGVGGLRHDLWLQSLARSGRGGGAAVLARVAAVDTVDNDNRHRYDRFYTTSKISCPSAR